jgi:holo-[acyl-carrier protein] synthase
MIFGIGTDIVRVARMQQSLDKHGERFARRILTEHELIGYQKANKPANYLAKRFAAKEATAKAMGTGFRDGLSLKHINVGHDAQGKPLLEFSGLAADFMAEKGIMEAHISLADEQEYAVAFVTLIKGS